ncbi:MAG: L,D-transpeptidase [Chloroflexi bacterium]|nr:L,D-transpeptidase [Chloroflexota bacterium]
MTLMTAQALYRPSARAGDLALAPSVAYAEQQPAGSPAVSAPALSAGAAAPSQPAQLQPGRSNVMTDLSATMGRTTPPSVTTWSGVAGLDVHRRATPDRSRPPVGDLKAGTPITVVRWVSGEEVEPHNDTWAELSDGTYVYSTSLRRNGEVTPPALPADAPTTGRWIDVNLTEQVATAYEGRTAVRSVLISSGRPGWETPTGTFAVLRRVEKDTMDGATLVGQGPNGAGANYKVENVRYVQYFTADGAAIHENYWRRPATFGMPGSHGCIGMTPADASWFWGFATVGTPLVIHE